ncbi:MAG: FIST N-terminal domain-containing protein [Phycisphaerales bacterium]
MIPGTSTGLCRLASGLSGSPEAGKAAERVCAQCAEGLGSGAVDLAVLFVSSHHVAKAGEIAAIIRRDLRADCLIGVSAESVVGGRTELERAPGVALLAARLPGVSLVPFTAEELSPFDESPDGLAKLGRGFGADADLRATFLFVDPFSVPVMGLLPAMNRARALAAAGGGAVGPLIGGISSGSTSPGGNAMLLDEAVHKTGLVGVSLKGPVRVDAVVSQGCRGFGPNLVVTKSRKNVILELSGRPALHMVRDVVEELPEDDKKLLERGLFMGRVINEYKERFGRDDFLIRNVVGVDENHNAIAVSDFVKVGQTVRFHLRDAKTADEDLAMLLDAQQLRDPPLGGLLVTCNGRGTRLFDAPGHDAEAIARAFAPGRGGEELAKGGREIDPEGPTLPLAGFHAAGEIGPVGGESYLHGQTACLALFRNPR